MHAPIIVTKLYIPPPRPKVVVRPRLIEQLNEGLNRKLTLVSAPAGFGKTTLVSEWGAMQKTQGAMQETHSPLPSPRIAWLSLDEADNDPTRFLTYLIAALQTVAANLGESALGALQSPQPPPTESILTSLLNEITVLPDNFVLVLDDYHVIDSKPVDTAIIFLLEHLPPQMHLLITTREDPPFPLPRLRARGQLTELRAADLRFTPSEAAEFLHAATPNLSEEDVAALEHRTEGWIAGLQLASLALRGQLSVRDRQDAPGFIRAFAGDHRYIVDYLVAEVLDRQAEPVRSFLLQTAILDRLNGSLCDAVTGFEGGSARLEALERGNFFVVPLDDQRHWYRYHHLFAEVLYAHLMAELPDRISTLHRRASEWYEQHGSATDAIRHALAAGDFERAADLVELAMPAMHRNRQFAMLMGWLKALPDELVRVRPVLSAGYASVSLSSGELEGMEARLRDAERWLDSTVRMRERQESPAAGMVVVDKGAFRRLPGTIALIRAGRALALGDMPETVENARRALALAPEDDLLMRGGAASQLGLAAWTGGDLETARRMTADGMANLRQAGYITAAIGGAIVLADIRIAQGCLQEAMTIYEQALQWAMPPGAPVLQGAADMYTGMSDLFREHNDLNAATQYLLTSRALGALAELPQNPYRWHVAMARIRAARGDLDEALDLLQEAERLYNPDFSPNVRPVATWKTRLWVAQGRFGEALGWAREHGLSADDDLSYLREFEHITLARVLLARHSVDRTDRSMHPAVGLLDRLLQAAEAGGRTANVIEILLLQALAHQTQDDIPAALVPLERALTLAEPKNYVRIFVDEGPAMAVLLEEAAKRRLAPNYVRHLLTAFSRPGDQMPVRQALIEPLTERELELLRLLATNLTGPEIARKLMVSLNTMRTHTKNTYQKLGVNAREAAVRRAEELGLL